MEGTGARFLNAADDGVMAPVGVVRGAAAFGEAGRGGICGSTAAVGCGGAGGRHGADDVQGPAPLCPPRWFYFLALDYRCVQYSVQLYSLGTRPWLWHERVQCSGLGLASWPRMECNVGLGVVPLGW